MTKIVRARLYWLPVEAGGRTTPPKSPYSTVARFEEEPSDWPKAAWSIVAEFKEEYAVSPETVATIRFLVPDAPHHLLHPGSRFELLEGTRVVARGEVMGYDA